MDPAIGTHIVERSGLSSPQPILPLAPQFCWLLREELDNELDDESESEDSNAYAEDAVAQLLTFAVTVTKDMQRLLAKNRGSDENCDVYQERFKSVLSGRALYYADLMAAAHNCSPTAIPVSSVKELATVLQCSSHQTEERCLPPFPDLQTIKLTAPEHTVLDTATGRMCLCPLPLEGRRLREYGCGPLEELFHVLDKVSGRREESVISLTCGHRSQTIVAPAHTDLSTAYNLETTQYLSLHSREGVAYRWPDLSGGYPARESMTTTGYSEVIDPWQMSNC